MMPVKIKISGEIYFPEAGKKAILSLGDAS